MTELEQAILRALVELDELVKSIPNPKPNLLPIFAKLDQFAVELPPDADPSLRHYLAKKSYEKARLWLVGREAENQRGNCRH